MKNRTFRAFLPRSPRPRKRGTSRLFVIGAAFAASTAVPGAGVGPAGAAQLGRNERTAAPSDAASAPAAQDRTAARFDIPPGRLRDVVARFEGVSGIRVTIAMDGIGDIQSAGVTGVMLPQQALERLLSGTGVSSSFTAPNAVTLDIKALSEFVAVSGDAPSPSSPKYTQPIRDTPQTIVVIPQAVLQEQGTTSLRDALRNTPGITLTAGEGGTAPGDNLLIRGFSARNDVYIDGARDPGVVSRDTFNTEAVEVAKGPSSVTAGRGSTGGSVNLVTKAANLQDSANRPGDWRQCQLQARHARRKPPAGQFGGVSNQRNVAGRRCPASR